MTINGILPVDKPAGITSFEVVRRIRKIIGAKKVGHTGTLDKFASGLLLICVGRATVVQQLFMELDKTYLATLLLGSETDTLDPYGRVIEECPVDEYPDSKIIEVLLQFRGRIIQIPPSFSAIHQNGERLYKLVMKGKKVSPGPREVEVRDIKLIDNKTGGKVPEIIFKATVSKGTYIRALGRDIARKLGTCGHLVSLRRSRIGNFSVDHALEYRMIVNSTVKESIIPLNEALKNLSRIQVSSENVKEVMNGIPIESVADEESLLRIPEGFFRIVCGDTLIAIGQKKGNRYRYFRVIAADSYKTINK